MNNSTSFPLHGYTLPLSPEGKSALVEPPPWHYGGEVIEIMFKADPDRVRELIPPPLEMGLEPGMCLLWFVHWISVSDSNPELVYINPERTQYNECLVMVGCQLNGEPGYLVSYAWVDNDFTLMRGFVQGFPKKLGRIYMTQLHDMNPVVGGKRAGARLRGICEAHGERIVTASLALTRLAQPTERPPVRFYLLRHFPDIEDPQRPAVQEIVESVVSHVEVGEIWAGEGEVSVAASEIEEVAALKPTEVRGGFLMSMGLTLAGGRVLYRYTDVLQK